MRQYTQNSNNVEKWGTIFVDELEKREYYSYIVKIAIFKQ